MSRLHAHASTATPRGSTRQRPAVSTEFSARLFETPIDRLKNV
jgi:hypothetical protein